MVTGMTTRRTSRDILVQDSRAFLDGFAANQRADPAERRRAIRKRRLKAELKRIPPYSQVAK